VGAKCVAPGDCASALCPAGFCAAAPTCFDGMLGGTETDVDCGGDVCGSCGTGASCLDGDDCASLVCGGAPASCQAATCSDGVENGGESAIDCGGATCAPCPPGATCIMGSDCASGVCSGAGTCALPTCFDATANAAETDVDCGGPVCPACGSGASCLDDGDCESDKCTAGACEAASCSDGVVNGGEPAVDCGGSCPVKCPDGSDCNVGADCASLVCAGPPGDKSCAAPTCTDAVKNGLETDYDCGGTVCPKCLSFQFCLVSSDCKGGACNPQTSQCDPTCTDGQLNGPESDVDCGGPCPQCLPNKDCFGPQDCTTGICSLVIGHGYHCQPAPSCFNGMLDGGETGVDCGGPLCGPC
jgi:hypothetical protein